MDIKDNSKDRMYFTIIPNYIANHSTANDQALYFQMKRLVGDKEGVCYASEKYFKDKLGIGSKALKKSIKYLLDHKWIGYAGLREIKTKGGTQKVKTYLVEDIWKLNVDYFSKGVSEREPLPKRQGVSESNARGVQKEAKGVAFEQQRRTKKNNIKEEPLFKVWNEKDEELVKLLHNTIIGNYPHLEKRMRFDKDCQEMNKIHRLDGWTYEQIKYIAKWSQQDNFWKQNILSVSKLRKQFDKLVVRAKEKSLNKKSKVAIII